MLENPDDVVGHKTFSTGHTDACGFPLLRHEPLTRAEADAILAQAQEAEERRAADMPDAQAALLVLFGAWQRLKELGWREAIYCPKDGSTFLVVEAGSTGIHECIYQGEWPTGSWWIASDGDLYPSRPILFKLREEPPAADAVDPHAASTGKPSTREKSL